MPASAKEKRASRAEQAPAKASLEKLMPGCQLLLCNLDFTHFTDLQKLETKCHVL